MTRTATVVSRRGKLMAKVERGESCAQCRACDFGRKEAVYVALPAGNYTEGEQIELSLAEGSLSRASLLAYGFPFVCLLAGLLLGHFVFSSEALQALCAVVFLAIGGAVLAVTEKRRRAKGRFAPCAEKETSIGGQDHGE